MGLSTSKIGIIFPKTQFLSPKLILIASKVSYDKVETYSYQFLLLHEGTVGKEGEGA